jgi:DNA-binding response OmpR family regulator
MMTGHAAIDTAVKAMQAGALDYIVKPSKLAAVLPVINVHSRYASCADGRLGYTGLRALIMNMVKGSWCGSDSGP